MATRRQVLQLGAASTALAIAPGTAWPVTVVNRPGASSNLATEAAVRAPGDPTVGERG